MPLSSRSRPPSAHAVGGRNSAIALAKALPLTLLLALSGCGGAKPSSDLPYLASFNLDAPITVTVSLHQPLDGQGNLAASDDTSFIALLVSADAIEVVPSLSSSPWWTFVAQTAAFSGDPLTVDVAHRVTVGRTDEKTWSENGADYYGETILYEVRPVGLFAKLSALKPIPGQIRLLLRKDSSSDQWKLWYGTDRGTRGSTAQDAPQMIHELTAAGDGDQYALTSAIGTARAKAFDEIERSLAVQGILERAKDDQEVLLSKRNSLAYYDVPHDLGSTGTYVDAQSYCAGLPAGRYHWRLPSIEELQKMAGPDTKLIDVPDGRLWISVAQTPNNDGILLVANTFVINNGPELTLDQINPADLNQYAWAQSLQLNPDRRTLPHQNPVDVRNARTTPVQTDPAFPVRVVCVSSL